jgi:quinol-cytochrome oxidoreductase complex cytochrome b subunit
MRFIKKYPLLNIVNSFVIDYPAPPNISYLWNFGVLAAFCLGIQIVTGIFLAMFYVPNIENAFSSVQYIMRDVNYGWLIRYIHANGASFFFICVYVHVFRGLYYNSYITPRELLWNLGVTILIVMILTAFLGYVLPWGQMSFWAATVITSLFSAIPIIGEYIVIWLWGGFSVDNATLNRFFSLHYLLPFVIALLSLIHVAVLHESGSSNPLNIALLSYSNKVPFHPYFVFKDLLGVLLFLIIFCYAVFFKPDSIIDPINNVPANPLVTPTHIVPEWYFPPFYAILRSIPNKLGGVITLALALIVLFLLPFITNKVFKGTFFEVFKVLLFWSFLSVCVLLGWIGFKPIEDPYLMLGQILTIFYFLYFFSLAVIAPALQAYSFRSVFK